MKGANNTYFGNIMEGITSLAKGLVITFRHLKDSRRSRKVNSIENKNYFDETVGISTIEYPHEAIPVPDNGRYRLTNEIDDCIVCDLCAKICPVNCIEIEAIKSTEEIGKTSDGSTKRIYAGVFNIDMAKCCYCGLCTTVCPTECLTMTKTYDYSEFDVRNMVYHFSDMSPADVEEKKKAYEEKQKLKAKPATIAKPESEQQDVSTAESTAVKKPFKPVIKPAAPKKTDEEAISKEETSISEQQKTIETSNGDIEDKESTSSEVKKPVPFKPRPIMKPKPAGNPEEEVTKALESENKEQIIEDKQVENKDSQTEQEVKKAVPFKPRPIMKPKPKEEEVKAEESEKKELPLENKEQPENKNSESEPEVKKPVPFKPRPIMKPKPKNPEGDNSENKE